MTPKGDSFANLVSNTSHPVGLCYFFLQRELSEHEEIVATSKDNVVKMFGSKSELLSAVVSRQRQLENQLEEAAKLAALLQSDAADRERCTYQLECDIQSLMDWINAAMEELNQLSVSPPSESDDDLLMRHNAVKVTKQKYMLMYNFYLLSYSSVKMLIFYKEFYSTICEH